MALDRLSLLGGAIPFMGFQEIILGSERDYEDICSNS